MTEKKKKNSPPKCLINFEIDHESRDKIKKIAKEEYRTLSGLLRKMVKNLIKERGK